MKLTKTNVENRCKQYVGTLPKTKKGDEKFKELSEIYRSVGSRIRRMGRNPDRKSLAKKIFDENHPSAFWHAWNGDKYTTTNNKRTIEEIHYSLRSAVPIEFATHFDVYVF